ncbi:MAG: LPS-assembly protein LptD, partial [Alistipes sp.]|nr:LPS-assembly protein LptD [Alistipes sp.]
MDRLKTKYLLLPVAALLFLLPMLGTARPCAGRLPAADSLFVRPDSSDREQGPRFPQPGPAAGNGRNAAPPESPLPADAAAPPLPGDSLAADTTAPRKNGAFLDDIISGKNRDSLYYDLRSRTIYIYNEGDISYQNINLKGDFMRIDMDDKMILAHGKPDTLDGVPTATHPVFTEGNATPY